MRKISLVLAALLGLSGVAYGAGWVQTRNTPGIQTWLAPAPGAHQVWEKIEYPTTHSVVSGGYRYDKIVMLSQADCKRGSLKIVQSNFFLRGQIVPVPSDTKAFYPIPGTGGAQILHMLCRKH